MLEILNQSPPMKRSALIIFLVASLFSESGCATAPRPAMTATYDNPDSSQPHVSFETEPPAKKPSWIRTILEQSLIAMAQHTAGSQK